MLSRDELKRDELTSGRFPRAGLKAHDEPDLERLREALESRDARPVLTRFDSRDG